MRLVRHHTQKQRVMQCWGPHRGERARWCRGSTLSLVNTHRHVRSHVTNGNIFLCTCVCHSMIQFHPNLSEYLPLPAAQQCCGWRGGGNALVLELASHQISLHLLHFLFILYPSPPSCAPLSLSPSLPVIYHYPLVIITVLKAADGHDNSCPILPAEFKRWFPLKKNWRLL